MDLVTITKLGALLRATIADYTMLHEKMVEIMAIGEELGEAMPDGYSDISRKYLVVIEEYVITNSILKLQYRNLQEFAQEVRDQEVTRHRVITKAQLELMHLDIDYIRMLPTLRKMISEINEILISSGTLQGEMLTMVGVVKDGELRV